MLAPDRNAPDRRRTVWLATAAAALVGVLVAGLVIASRSDDGDEPVTTEVPPPTSVEETPVTSVDDSTDTTPDETTPDTTPDETTVDTAPPATTAPLGSEFAGVVWESPDDPDRVNASVEQPDFVDEPVTGRVTSFVITPGPDESQVCAAAVEEGRTDRSGAEVELPEIEWCLVVNWDFEIGDEATNNGTMDSQAAEIADGELVEPLVFDIATAAPGDTGSGTSVYGNVGPGAVIPFLYQVEFEGGIVFNRWNVTVPDEFQSIDWFEDGS